MTDDQKSLLKDLFRHEGWKLLEELNKQAIEDYRRLAVQAPNAEITEEMRTWYAAKAEGREELLAELKEKML